MRGLSFFFPFSSYAKKGLPAGSSLEPSPGSNFRCQKEKEKRRFKAPPTVFVMGEDTLKGGRVGQ